MNTPTVETLAWCWCCHWRDCGGIGAPGLRVGGVEKCMRCWREEAPETDEYQDGGGHYTDEPEPETAP